MGYGLAPPPHHRIHPPAATAARLDLGGADDLEVVGVVASRSLARPEDGLAGGIVIAEVDARKLYTEAACSSMFSYCTQRLGLSENASQGRIVVARASRRWPFLLDALAEGWRCGSRRFIEYHHLDPWGKSREHSRDRLTLRCRAHNQHAARTDYAAEHIAARIDEQRSL